MHFHQRIRYKMLTQSRWHLEGRVRDILDAFKLDRALTITHKDVQERMFPERPLSPVSTQSDPCYGDEEYVRQDE